MSYYGANSKYTRIQDFPERFSAGDVRKYQIFTRDKWECRSCGKSAEVLAYLLEPMAVNARLVCDAWYKLWRERYSIDWFTQHVLEHDENRIASCERHQNMFDISRRPEDIERMLVEIRRIEKNLQATKQHSIFDFGDHGNGGRKKR